MTSRYLVIPAKAGTQAVFGNYPRSKHHSIFVNNRLACMAWVPASAGMTKNPLLDVLDPHPVGLIPFLLFSQARPSMADIAATAWVAVCLKLNPVKVASSGPLAV